MQRPASADPVDSRKLWAPSVRYWIVRLLDWIFQPGCAACDRLVAAGQPLCAGCELSLYDSEGACPRCAEPSGGPLDLLCPRCRAAPPAFAALTAPFRFGGQLAVALRRLKFHRRREVARALGPLLAGPLARAAAGADLIVPVPLHWRRRSARGFNQAQLLARFAGAAPLAPRVLRRRRATRPQTGLDRRARARNLAGAFRVPHPAAVRDRRILLFDDVVTTGATMNEAARALLDAGATEVRGFAVARAEAGEMR
jgi:ComF family protein